MIIDPKALLGEHDYASSIGMLHPNTLRDLIQERRIADVLFPREI
jgi:hypothetical protein